MAERLPARKTIGATEVRNNLSELLNRVYRGDEHVVIEKLGIPVAALISAREYEEYRRLVAQQVHRELGRALGAEADRQGLTEERLIEELKEVRRGVFKDTYGDLHS